MSYTALESFLKPLHNIFLEDGVNEIIINNPGEIWVEKTPEFICQNIPELTYEHLMGLGRLVAQSTNQVISENNPLLSATLPNGYRIQIIFPPVVSDDNVAISIRKFNPIVMTIDDYDKNGAFDNTVIKAGIDDNDIELSKYLHNKQIKEFLKSAVKYKKNIIISGGTSSGKTTFTNAALVAIPDHERIITIEDAREIRLPNHKNKLHLLVSKGMQSVADIDMVQLIEACLRLRPDRIIIGEIRGKEAFSFLRAINTGHPGSICTVHADTPAMAIEQIKLMVMQAGLGMTSHDIKKYVNSVIDIIIQLKKSSAGKRFISEIYFKGDQHG